MSRRTRFTRNLGRRLESPLPVRTTVEWIRFEHDREPYGVFCYLNEAREKLATAERDELDGINDWFSEYLRVLKPVTIERFWFCAEAVAYVAKARRLAAILRTAGIPIVERRTQRIPGKVIREDRHQVAVRTYRDTPQPRKAAV